LRAYNGFDSLHDRYSKPLGALFPFLKFNSQRRVGIRRRLNSGRSCYIRRGRRTLWRGGFGCWGCSALVIGVSQSISSSGGAQVICRGRFCAGFSTRSQGSRSLDPNRGIDRSRPPNQSKVRNRSANRVPKAVNRPITEESKLLEVKNNRSRKAE
jgi:hypothetical protein